MKGRNNSKTGRKIKFEDESYEYIKNSYYYTFLIENLGRS